MFSRMLHWFLRPWPMRPVGQRSSTWVTVITAWLSAGSGRLRRNAGGVAAGQAIARAAAPGGDQEGEQPGDLVWASGDLPGWWPTAACMFAGGGDGQESARQHGEGDQRCREAQM